MVLSMLLAAVFGNPDLPVVVLSGDSVTLGMRPWVAGELAGMARVYGLPENGRYTGYALEHWDAWQDSLVEISAFSKSFTTKGHEGGEGEAVSADGAKGAGGQEGEKRTAAKAGKSVARVDVVVLGHGLWDIAQVMPDGGYRTPIDVYEANMRALIERGLGMNASGPGPVVVVNTITPVPFGFSEISTDVDARKYNLVLARLVEEFRGDGARVRLCDLYAAALPNLPEWQKPNDIHFWSWGYRGLAERVGKSVRGALLGELWVPSLGVWNWWGLLCFAVAGCVALKGRVLG